MEIFKELVWHNSKTSRAYRCIAGVDLLGDIFVSRFWGSTENGSGNSKTSIYPDRSNAFFAVQSVVAERQKKGYLLIKEYNNANF